MARRRRSHLAGSPAQHALRAKKSDELASRLFRESHEDARGGRCDSALYNLLSAEFMYGMSDGNVEWMEGAGSSEYSRNPSGIEMTAEDAVDAFEQACLVKGKLSGMRRRKGK